MNGYIRQMAKDQPPVYIVASTPASIEVAHQVDQLIEGNREFKKDKKIRIMTPTGFASELATNPKDNKNYSAIFLICRGENPDPMPAALTSICPLTETGYSGETSGLKAVTTNQSSGKITFNIACSAPDKDRLMLLVNRFEIQSFPGKSFTISEDYETYRATVFGPEDEKAQLTKWATKPGKLVWNYIDFVPIDKYAAPASPRDVAYFIDRSAKVNVPADALKAIGSRAIAPTGIYAVKTTSADGHATVVCTAPTKLLLSHMSQKYGGLDKISDAGEYRDVLDFRDMGATAVFVLCHSQDHDITNQARDQISALLRSKGVDVQDSGSLKGIQTTLNENGLPTNDSDYLSFKQSSGLNRCVWVFELAASGRNEYKTSMEQLDKDPGAFTDPDPQSPSKKEPFGKPKSQDQYNREYSQYLTDHKKWVEDKKSFEDSRANAQVRWSRSVEQTSTATGQGTLLLLDLDSGGKILWQTPITGEAVKNSVYNSDTTVVNGYDGQPSSPETPPNAEGQVAQDLSVAALVNAAGQGVEKSTDELWLPDGTLPIKKPGPNPPQAPPPPATDGPVVADVSEDGVTINIGSADRVKVGDKIYVITETKEITDPQTGKVIETRIVDRMACLVTEVHEKACDCVPIGTDKDKLKKVQVGMKVKWVPKKA